jgi:hypothetical protein
MKRRAIFAVLFVAPIAILCGCAQDTGGEWNTEVWPESTVQANYCTEMPHDELEEPEVVRESEDTWAINYPVFRKGCGAYQYTAAFMWPWEGESKGGIPVYLYEMSVCNRCEEPHQIDLVSIEDTQGEPPPKHLKKVPDSPDITEVNSLGWAAAPAVEHTTSPEEDVILENPICAIDNGGTQVITTPYVSYESLDRFVLQPGEKTISDRMLPPKNNRAEFLPEFHRHGGDTTHLRWPRLLHHKAPVDGRHAAGRPEYCSATVLDGKPSGYGTLSRAYDVPYDVDEKYVTQTVSLPTLPDELVRRLEEGAEE